MNVHQLYETSIGNADGSKEHREHGGGFVRSLLPTCAAHTNETNTDPRSSRLGHVRGAMLTEGDF